MSAHDAAGHAQPGTTERRVRHLWNAALAVATVTTAQPSRGDDAIVTYKSLSPEAALELARTALESCRAQGYQVAVVVMDRFGQPLVLLRDRFAAPLAPSTANDKAYTAVSFRSNTSDFAKSVQSGQLSSGLTALPHVVTLGGGVVIEAGGSLLGSIGVAGAPGGEKDEACAKAGLDAIRDRLDF